MKLYLFFFSSLCAFGGPVSLGVKAGIPLDSTASADTRTSIDHPRWILGPTVELRLSSRFTLGADALYRQLNVSRVSNVGSAVFSTTSATNHWEVPLFLKFRLTGGPFRPFVSGRGAFDHAAIQSRSSCTGDPILCGIRF